MGKVQTTGRRGPSARSRPGTRSRRRVGSRRAQRRHYTRHLDQVSRQQRRMVRRDRRSDVLSSPRRSLRRFRSLQAIRNTPSALPISQRLGPRQRSMYRALIDKYDSPSKLARRTTLKAKGTAEAEGRHPWNIGIADAIDKDVAAKGREILAGSSNPNLGELAGSAALWLIPGAGAARALRSAPTIVRGTKGLAARGAGRVAEGRAGREAAREARSVLGASSRRATPSLPRRAAGRLRTGRRPGTRRSGLPTRIPRTKAQWKRAPGRLKGGVKRAPSTVAGKAKRAPTAAKETLKGRPPPGGKMERFGSLAMVTGPLGAPAAGAVNWLSAAKEDPGKTLGTTARAAPAIATAPIAIAGDIGHAALTGDTKPIEGQIQQQIDYWKLVEGMMSGQGADITDPKTGQTIHRTPEQIVQEDVGGIPLLGAGLTVVGGRKAALNRGVGTPRRTPLQVARDARQGRLEQTAQSHPKLTERQKARDKRLGMKAPWHERRRDRREEAASHATTGERSEKKTELDMTTFSGRRRFFGKHKRLDVKINDLAREQLTDKVTPADTLQLIGRHGLHGQPPHVVRERVAKIRSQLVEPAEGGMDLLNRLDEIHTRDVLDALDKNPEIPSRPDVMQVLREYEAADVRKSVERHALVTGQHETLPNPRDEPRRYRPQAREMGVPTEEYRPKPELRDVVDVQPRKGETMDQALRRTMNQRRREAKALERQAVQVERAGKRAAAERVKGDRTRLPDRTAEQIDARIGPARDRVADLERRVAEAERSIPTAPGILRDTAQAAHRDLQKQLSRAQGRVRRLIADRRALGEGETGTRVSGPARQRAESLVRESRTKAAAMRERAAGYRGVATQIDNVIGREGRAKDLDRQAKAAREAGDIEAAANFEAGAAALRRAVVESETQLSKEFVREMRERVRQGNYTEPIYFTERDVTNKGVLNVAGDYPGSKVPKAEYRNMQRLAADGRIDEAGATLLETMTRNRATLEMTKHVRDFLSRALLKDKGGNVLIMTGKEARQRAQNFEFPPGTGLFPVQEFERAMKAGDYEQAAKLIADDPISLAIREGKLDPGKKYGLVSQARLKEFRDQMNDYSGGLKAVRASARIQSIAMLAFSPMWFGFQLLASPLAGAVAQPNPYRWARAMKTYVDDFQKLDPYERVNFQSQYGATSADAIALQRNQAGLTPATLRDMADAAGVGIKSPIGRLGSLVAHEARKGGPLISINRRYEGMVRDLVALIELDKRSKASKESTMQLIGKIGNAHDHTAKALAYLKDKPFEETIRYMTGERGAPLRDAVNDALGDWTALTKRERPIAAATVFYPFLRFSTRWLFNSMPRNHPVRLAVLTQLAQANAEQLEMLLGGEPAFFSDWGKLVMHVSEDNPIALNLGRVAPGSNAMMEVFGQGGVNLQSALAPFQPVAGAVAGALAKQSPTGRPSELSQKDLFLRSVVGLVTPLRAEARKIGGESDYSKLFLAIQEREPNLKGYAFTRVVDDLSRDAKAVYASNLMRKAFEDNDYEARKELDEMMASYGLVGPITKAAQTRAASPSTSTSSSTSSSSAGWRSSSSTSGTSSSGGWRP